MSEAVQYRAGQTLRAEDLGPLFEREVRGHDHARLFVGGGDHVEEEFAAEFAGSGFIRKNVAKFIEDQEVKLGELGFHPHQLAFFASFHQLRDQLGHAMEPDLLALTACGDTECRSKVCFSRPGMADKDNRFTFCEIFAAHQLANE